MNLYVTRHGESEFNAQFRYAGSTDVPLSDLGVRQAEQLARNLREIQLDCIVSSPLLRARQTSEIINYDRGLPLRIVDEFKERNMGVYEGLTRQEAKSKYPDTWAKLGARGLDDAPTGGETIRQCDARVTAALKKLILDEGEKTVLLVCHGFVARLINRYFLQLPYDEMHCFTLDNCGIANYRV